MPAPVAVRPDPSSLPPGQQERRERIVQAAISLLERGEYDAIQRARPSATDGVATGEAQLRALMRRAVRAFEHYPQMMRVEVVLESSTDPNARALFDEFAGNNRRALTDALSSVDADTAAAIVETVNSVFVTRLRSWALGRATIGDVDRSVQRTLDLIFD
jgi:AcrR family transcriptional regulator